MTGPFLLNYKTLTLQNSEIEAERKYIKNVVHLVRKLIWQQRYEGLTDKTRCSHTEEVACSIKIGQLRLAVYQSMESSLGNKCTSDMYVSTTFYRRSRDPDFRPMKNPQNQARLKPHPLAALFPELLPEELTQLARDIKERGQLEPIILHKGLILDGRNRYKACQIAGVKPWTEEFNAKTAKRSPTEFVLSRNLRRRHLSVGQKASIALEWSNQIELNPEPEKNKERGRPKGALSEMARKIGINEQRVFELRQIREANPNLYQDVKAGRRSLNGALAEIGPPRETRFLESDLGESESTSQELDRIAQRAKRELAQPPGGKVARGARKPAGNESTAAVKLPLSPAATQKALARIKAILGSWFCAEVKARNLIQKPEEIVQFAKFTDAQMLEIGPLLKRGWTFVAASREVIKRLTPDDQIRMLHTRAVENGGNWCLLSVGNFGHLVVWGTEKDKTLAKIKDTLARP